MQRRHFVIAGSAGLCLPAWAHHGWSSFDTDRPIFLEGLARQVSWRNPHVELELELLLPLLLPDGLEVLPLPDQTAGVDRAAFLKKTVLPTRKDRRWKIELAPLSRLEEWKVRPIKDGTSCAVMGYTFAGEKGPAVLRAEYLFVHGKGYGLRSSPV